MRLYNDMKKSILLLLLLTIAGIYNAGAWGALGHDIIVEIAKRHLTEKAKANIAKYMPYDITTESSWMDYHRHDKGIEYTTSWHVYNVDEKYEYDMNPRLYKGDAILAMKVSDFNLMKYRELSDSAVVMNLRFVLHFTGDIHCPTHSYVPGPRCFWPCELNGKRLKSFHSLYDYIPDDLYPNKSAKEIAAELDNCSKSERKRICKGDFHAWAHDIGKRNAVIYKWNPHNTKVLDPNTIELSRELTDIQLRDAGYRLAYLLNKYFGE